MNITQHFFGKTCDGNSPTLFTLSNDPMEEYPSEQYPANCHCFGFIVGQVCNLISKGKFVLCGIKYKLPINNEDRYIYGGMEGFDKITRKATKIEKRDQVEIQLKYSSVDEEISDKKTGTEKN